MLTNRIIVAAFLVIFTGNLSAQEKPLTVNGTFSSGFYNSYTRGGGTGDQKLRFVPAGASFDINSFFLTPDLVNMTFQPQFNIGPQASDAGFVGGNGISSTVSILRRNVVPLTFRYSNLQLEDVYFGSLSQISSYSLRNRIKDLGFSAELNHAGLPHVTVDWGKGSVVSRPDLETIPDYHSDSDHLNVDSRFVRWGWDLQGFAHHQKQTSDLITPVDEGVVTSTLEQKVMQYQGSARRSLGKDSELYLDGGSQSTDNLLLKQPLDLTTHYANASLRFFQRRRWKTSLRAGYTSNITGILLTQLVGGLGGNGSIAPDASILQPLRNRVSNLNLDALTSVDLSHGLNLYGSVDRTAVLVAGNTGLRSSYVTTAAGMTYTHTFGWGTLSGQYGREYGTGSVTGQTGRIQGQNYYAAVQHGNPDVLQFDISVHGNDHSVRNELPADQHSISSDASVGRRLFGQLGVRVGGGWQQSTFTNGGNEFNTKGYTAHAGIEHPRFQLNGSLNTSAGNSLQVYGGLPGGIGVESVLMAPLQMVPSDLRGMSFSLHANPARKVEVSAIWTRSIQHLQGTVANDFEIIDVHATYHFRKLQFELGFFRSDQVFSSYLATYPKTQRGRFYFRMSRSEKIL